MNDLHQIAEAATQLGDRLPHWVLASLAEAVVQHGATEWPTAKTMILHRLPTSEFRDAAANFLDHWRMTANGLTPQAVAAALVTAAKAEFTHRQEETAEIVWTGPETADTRFRHTEQAILEVLNSATKRLTVVSYAVYRISRIREVLVAAANRGVSIRLIVETPNRIKGQSEYDCLLALGENVAPVASVYYWPQEGRPRTTTARSASCTSSVPWPVGTGSSCRVQTSLITPSRSIWSWGCW
jgi:phosphatidylserine/phosphatidylglycerophosphate/cardiolipin synthase-like enzyme